MRSRTALAGVLVCLLAGGCGTTTAPPSPPVATVSPAAPPAPTRAATSATATPTIGPAPQKPTRPPDPEPTCAELVEHLSLAEQVGQLLMVGIDSAGPTAAVGDVLSRTRTGSVILLGNSTAGRAGVQRVVGRVRQDTRRPAKIKTLLAADQEGGLVQRLKGSGFAIIPSAQDQARLSDRALQRRAETWGKQLAAAGIDADLAPVADVVPTGVGRRNQPIGALRRGYGPDPGVVADKVTAFTRGMAAADVITAVKHFPGLGRVTGNTDFVARVTDSQTRRRDPNLAGFAAAIEADVDMVMVSSAYYSRIDPDRRAAFSSTIITTMLRGDLDFSGVVISDDLSAAAMQDLSPGQRAIRFVRAGGDLAIVGNPAQAPAMASALRREAADPQFRRAIAAAATRVVAMKAEHGLAPC